MRRPLVEGCLFFCLGILVANFAHIPFFIYYIFALISLVSSLIFLRKGLISNILIYSTIFFIGAIIFKNSQILPPNHINKYIKSKGTIVSLKGSIYTDPIIRQTNISKKISFELSVEEIKIKSAWQKICGRILVNVYQDRIFSYADELTLKGKLYRVPNFDISKKLNYRQYLARRGIYGILSISKRDEILVTGKKYANPIKALAYKAKEAMREKIDYYVSGLEANILKAIILGERQDIPRDLKNIFIQTGTAHILAISGLHIGIITFILLVFLKVFRIPKKPRYIFTILILVIYTFITGARASVIRSALMITVILVGILFEREIDIYNSLSFAAIAILAYNPNQLFDIGFQLSFISVISIFYFGYRIQQYLFKLIHNNSKIIGLIIRSFSISLGVWIGVLAIIAFYFDIIVPITILANLFVIPLISIIIALSFSVILSGFLLPFLSSFFAVTTKFLVAVLIRFTYLFSKIPGAYFDIENFTIYWIIIYYLVIIGLFNVKGLLELTKLSKYDKLR